MLWDSGLHIVDCPGWSSKIWEHVFSPVFWFLQLGEVIYVHFTDFVCHLDLSSAEDYVIGLCWWSPSECGPLSIMELLLFLTGWLCLGRLVTDCGVFLLNNMDMLSIEGFVVFFLSCAGSISCAVAKLKAQLSDFRANDLHTGGWCTWCQRGVMVYIRVPESSYDWNFFHG